MQFSSEDEGAKRLTLTDEVPVVRDAVRELHRLGQLQVFVKTVEAATPACRAGLRAGDQIVEVNGQSVTTATQAEVELMIEEVTDTLVLTVRPLNREKLAQDLILSSGIKNHQLRTSARKLAAFFNDASDGRDLLAASDGTARAGVLHRKVVAVPGAKKSKRRNWKQHHAVLRGHELSFYDAPPPAAAAAAAAAVPQPESGTVCIKAAICDIAYNYKKRNFVFRLVTPDQAEFLLQAQSKDDMLGWIAAIQTNSNPDNVDSVHNELIIQRAAGRSRAKSPNIFGKTNRAGAQADARRNQNTMLGNVLRRRPSVSSPRTRAAAANANNMELTLLDICDKYQCTVSPVLSKCIAEVERRGLHREGIYRLAGSHSMGQRLKDAMARDIASVDLSNEQLWGDTHAICGLVKSYIRDLREPVLTSRGYSHFIQAGNLQDYESRLYVLKSLVHQLPRCHFDTLEFLVRHLSRVTEHSEQNKMAAKNLAIVFGPTLIRPGVDCVITMVPQRGKKKKKKKKKKKRRTRRKEEEKRQQAARRSTITHLVCLGTQLFVLLSSFFFLSSFFLLASFFFLSSFFFLLASFFFLLSSSTNNIDQRHVAAVRHHGGVHFAVRVDLCQGRRAERRGHRAGQQPHGQRRLPGRIHRAAGVSHRHGAVHAVGQERGAAPLARVVAGARGLGGRGGARGPGAAGGPGPGRSRGHHSRCRP